MAISVLMAGNCSDHLESTRTREMEMSSLMMNGSGDQKQHTTRTGKPGRRKKSKLQSELAQKKKTPQRGMGVEQLERIRAGLGAERVVKKMTHHHEHYINPSAAAVPHSSLISHHQVHHHQQHFSPAAFGGAFSLTNGGSGSDGLGGQHHQTPALSQFQGLNSGINGGGFHGTHVINSSSGGVLGPLFSDDTFVSHDPFAAIGVGSRIRARNGNTEASKELSSIPNNMKWYSEQCGFCHKKFRGSGETIMCNGERKMSCGDQLIMSPVNGFGSFAHVGNKGNMFNGGILNYFASQTKPQVVKVMAVHSKGNSSTAGGGSSVVMEYEFFPAGKFGGSSSSSSSSFNIKQQEVLISLKTEASSSVVHEQASMVGEASSSSAAAAVATSSICSDHHHHHHHFLDHDQNSNSIDLSLKLSSYI